MTTLTYTGISSRLFPTTEEILINEMILSDDDYLDIDAWLDELERNHEDQAVRIELAMRDLDSKANTWLYNH